MDDKLTLTRQIQLKELEILKIFQEICRQHNLRYFAIGGTCLGAVRHKGFIPWDDDMDLVMPYEDYMKFQEITLPSGYEFLNYRSAKRTSFLNRASKIHDINTTFIENSNRNNPERYSGVYIDIYPINGLPKSKAEIKSMLFFSRLYLKLDRAVRMEYSDMKTLKGKVLWLLSAPVIKSFMRISGLPYYYFSMKREKITSKYPFGSSDKVLFPWRRGKHNKEGWYTNIFPYECFRTSQDFY